MVPRSDAQSDGTERMVKQGEKAKEPHCDKKKKKRTASQATTLFYFDSLPPLTQANDDIIVTKINMQRSEIS